MYEPEAGINIELWLRRTLVHLKFLSSMIAMVNFSKPISMVIINQQLKCATQRSLIAAIQPGS